MDASESTLSTSPSQSASFSPQRHFYLAVDRLQFKMETLVDLLGMAGRRPSLPMVVCCNSRDELDAVDLSEGDRAQVVGKFRQATQRWNRHGGMETNGDSDTEDKLKSHLVVVTDACLPLVGSGELPLGARLLINYELPAKKETYMRRMSTCLSADGLVINMVVGGEVVTLKSLEESSGLIIDEMPMHIFEMM